LEIKDIVEQEKHKRTLTKIRKREDAITRKQFLKDCYKFWKEYKKVESPYFWWIYIFYDEKVVLGDIRYFYWACSEAPKNYVENSWWKKKWKISLSGSKLGIIRNADPHKRTILL